MEAVDAGEEEGRSGRGGERPSPEGHRPIALSGRRTAAVGRSKTAEEPSIPTSALFASSAAEESLLPFPTSALTSSLSSPFLSSAPSLHRADAFSSVSAPSSPSPYQTTPAPPRTVLPTTAGRATAPGAGASPPLAVKPSAHPVRGTGSEGQGSGSTALSPLQSGGGRGGERTFRSGMTGKEVEEDEAAKRDEGEEVEDSEDEEEGGEPPMSTSAVASTVSSSLPPGLSSSPPPLRRRRRRPLSQGWSLSVHRGGGGGPFLSSQASSTASPTPLSEGLAQSPSPYHSALSSSSSASFPTASTSASASCPVIPAPTVSASPMSTSLGATPSLSSPPPPSPSVSLVLGGKEIGVLSLAQVQLLAAGPRAEGEGGVGRCREGG